MGDMEWAEIMKEWIVVDGIVDGEEDCSLLWLWCLCEEAQIEAIYI